MTKIVLSIYLPETIRTYIEDVAEAQDRPLTWVAYKFLEYAVEHHKKGEFEV
jgi:hypothetical protein